MGIGEQLVSFPQEKHGCKKALPHSLLIRAPEWRTQSIDQLASYTCCLCILQRADYSLVDQGTCTFCQIRCISAIASRPSGFFHWIHRVVISSITLTSKLVTSLRSYSAKMKFSRLSLAESSLVLSCPSVSHSILRQSSSDQFFFNSSDILNSVFPGNSSSTAHARAGIGAGVHQSLSSILSGDFTSPRTARSVMNTFGQKPSAKVGQLDRSVENDR